MSIEKLEELMQQTHQMAHSIRRLTHYYHKQEEQPMMHPGQGRLLALVMEKQPVSQKDLVDILDIRPSSLSEALKKLETKGMITRRSDEQDKRNVIVEVTEEGAKLAKGVEAGREQIARQVFGALTEEEQQELSGLLKKLADAWQETLKDVPDEPHPPHGACGPHGRPPFPPGHMREHHMQSYMGCKGKRPERTW